MLELELEDKENQDQQEVLGYEAAPTSRSVRARRGSYVSVYMAILKADFTPQSGTQDPSNRGA